MSVGEAAPLWIWLASALLGAAAACFVLALAPVQASQAKASSSTSASRRKLYGALLRRAGGSQLQRTLWAAGYSAPQAAAIYRVMQVACAAGTAGFAGWASAFSALEGGGVIPLVMAGSCIGAVLPALFLKARLRRKLARISRALPSGIDLLCIGMSAGLTAEAALARAAREIAGFAPELAQEFHSMAFALGNPSLVSSDEGYALPPPDLPEWRAFAKCLHQTERHGMSAIPSLRALAARLRQERAARCEAAAARLGPRLTIPLILFFLPPIFLLILAPAALSLLKP
jgi:Flp pilus assembly protein TadB